MALLFSAVTVTAGEDEIELLVGGIPREYDDLEGWSEFDDLMYFISEETEVSVCAEAYLYGEGESMRATPEEIDDLMQRIKDDSGFLNRCCSNLESVRNFWTLPRRPCCGLKRTGSSAEIHTGAYGRCGDIRLRPRNRPFCTGWVKRRAYPCTSIRAALRRRRRKRYFRIKICVYNI